MGAERGVYTSAYGQGGQGCEGGTEGFNFIVIFIRGGGARGQARGKEVLECGEDPIVFFEDTLDPAG